MSAEELTGIRSILARQAQPTPREPEKAGAEEEADFRAFAFGRIGNRPQLTLLFRKSSGEVSGFPYAHFDGIRSDDPSRGFTVTFGEASVTVEGRNLDKLFGYVCDHKVAEILEAGRAQVLESEWESPLVISIIIQ